MSLIKHQQTCHDKGTQLVDRDSKLQELKVEVAALAALQVIETAPGVELVFGEHSRKRRQKNVIVFNTAESTLEVKE